MEKKKIWHLWVEAPPLGRPESTGVKRGNTVLYHPLARTTRCAVTRTGNFVDVATQMELMYPSFNGQPQWGLLTEHQIKALRAFYDVARSNTIVTRRR